MKKRNVLIASVFGLAAAVIAGGYALSAKAFDYNRSSNRAISRNWENSSWYQELTDDQKALLESIRANQEKEALARQTAMDKVISSGDYDSWVALVQQHMGEDAPILTRVTAANFPAFVEGYKLMQQSRLLMDEAQEKFSSIGLEGMGFGMGKGMMRPGKGFGGHFNMLGFDASTESGTIE